jgi:hypothetical protein
VVRGGHYFLAMRKKCSEAGITMMEGFQKEDSIMHIEVVLTKTSLHLQNAETALQLMGGKILELEKNELQPLAAMMESIRANTIARCYNEEINSILTQYLPELDEYKPIVSAINEQLVTMRQRFDNYSRRLQIIQKAQDSNLPKAQRLIAIA